MENCARSRLVLIEGIPGSGKTILTDTLLQRLLARGLAAVGYDEGARDHTASLNWHACFDETAYHALLNAYPQDAEHIRRRAVHSWPYVLIPYDNDPYYAERPGLMATLRAHECCYTQQPTVPLDAFTALLTTHWARFTQATLRASAPVLLNAVFLQHPMHDLLRLYQATEAAIARHIHAIAGAIAPLQPVLRYLSHPDVRRQMQWIAGVRQKAHHASEEMIALQEKRKRIEMAMLPTLPFSAHVLENDGRSWDDVMKRAETIVLSCI